MNFEGTRLVITLDPVPLPSRGQTTSPSICSVARLGRDTFFCSQCAPNAVRVGFKESLS